MPPSIPILDLSRLSGAPAERESFVRDLSLACAEYGFFLIEGHAVPETLQNRLEELSAEFFRRPLAEKMEIAMVKGGRAWRGYFSIGDELTSGRPDLKEGLYFGSELDSDDPRVRSGLPLHGPNLFPSEAWRETVIAYLAALTELGHVLVGAISEGLGLPTDYFRRTFTADPITLFRVFHYPPSSGAIESRFPWGVGEHTDYGLLTLLKQDDCGGLEVRAPAGWIPVPPRPNTFVCNVGDMLDALSRGKYRSAPHRVRNRSGRDRYSYPFFFDPGFAAPVRPLPIPDFPRSEAGERWDRENLYLFQGTYGEYLLKKVAKVFPLLARAQGPH